MTKVGHIGPLASIQKRIFYDNDQIGREKYATVAGVPFLKLR